MSDFMKFDESQMVVPGELSVDELTQASSSPLPIVRAMVAAQPLTPQDVLLTLAKDEDTDVQIAVAHNPLSYFTVTRALLAVDDENVREHVLTCSVPNAAFIKLVKHGSYDDVYSMLRNTELHTRMVAELFERANGGEFGVCRDLEALGLIAFHPNTPEHVRRAIADRNHEGLNCYLARSPYTPLDLLLRFLESEDLTVQMLARLNRALPDSVQEFVAVKDGVDVQVVLNLLDAAELYDPEVVPVH